VLEFTRLPDLGAPDATNPAGHLLSLKTAVGTPESFLFRFFALPDGMLALGGLDLQEQARLRNELLGLNRESNDLARQLHQANAELAELNQLKNQFLGMAAHDLRKPIGIIMTYSEFVLDEAGEQLSAQLREFLRTGLTAAGDMKRLIDNFLDVAVIESGNLRMELTPTSAREILTEVEPMVRLLAAKKKVTLMVDAADDGRRFLADASKLQQVLLNLVGNAVEHSFPGRRVWLSSRWESQNLVFAVRDEGRGIEPKDQAQLFSAFARAGTRKTAGERSVGLGLAIARLVVEAHGGRLWVESVPCEGATFIFSLPMREQSPAR